MSYQILAETKETRSDQVNIRVSKFISIKFFYGSLRLKKDTEYFQTCNNSSSVVKRKADEFGCLIEFKTVFVSNN